MYDIYIFSRFVASILNIFNILNMNEDVNLFSFILIHNIHMSHFLILVCICHYVFRIFFATLQCTSTNSKMHWIAIGCVEMETCVVDMG
jgi:hypothetical protein